MKRGCVFTWGAALMISAAGEASAQLPVLELQISPAAGATFFVTDLQDRFALERESGGSVLVVDGRLRHSYAVGGSAGLRLGDWGAVEGMLFWVPTELTASGGIEGGGTDVDAYMYAANGLFFLPRIGRAEPFLSLGLGVERMDFAAPDLASHTDLLWSFGPGIVYQRTRHVGVRIDLKDCVTSFNSHLDGAEDQAQHELMLIVSLNVRRTLGRN